MDATNGSEEFIRVIEGTYTNKKQAQSDPTGFIWAWIQWINLGDSKLQSRQWYHHDGEVYRERNFEVQQLDNTIILVNHTLDWKPVGCDIQWFAAHDGWKSEGSCRIADLEVYYTGYLTKDQYRSWDRGFVDGKQVIGNTKSEFIFDRQYKKL